MRWTTAYMFARLFAREAKEFAWSECGENPIHSMSMADVGNSNGRSRWATDWRLLACGSVSRIRMLGTVPRSVVFPDLGGPVTMHLRYFGKSALPVLLNIAV